MKYKTHETRYVGMNPPWKPSPLTVKNIIHLYCTGVPPYEIAHRYGRNPAIIERVIRDGIREKNLFNDDWELLKQRVKKHCPQSRYYCPKVHLDETDRTY